MYSTAQNALSQTATSALLLLPLGPVVAARFLRPRRLRSRAGHDAAVHSDY